MNSRERVRSLLAGQLPDRPPLFDVIRNDAVIEHFGEAALAPDTVRDTVVRAHAAALDSTKSFYRMPEFNPGASPGADGRLVTRRRWTTWTAPAVYSSSADYAQQKTAATADPWDWNAQDEMALEEAIASWVSASEESGDIVRTFVYPGPPRLDSIFPEVGLEAFSYYMVDCPDILHRQIEHRFVKLEQAIAHADLPEEVVIVSESCDIAFKTGLLFPPEFLRQAFVPGYRRVCDAVHRAGRKVQFHSDGNLWEILDDLVEAGIDLLHPLEPLAGMDPRELHRRYPGLILCGGIDVSQLLPFGTEQEIADQVKRNIDATEGRIMVGSSTEINNEVPLCNYLALHEATVGYAY